MRTASARGERKLPCGSGLLLTGTDTGIGKTTVGCALAAALRERGRRVGVFKPIETGCRDVEGRLVPDDALRLRFFAGSEQPLDEICPYRFRAPLAPAVAASLEGNEIDMTALAARLRAIAKRHDVTLVEGAGGLLVPISGALTFADLGRQNDLPVLVVVGNRLGAINHTLLTVHWAESAGLEVKGYAVNSLAEDEDLAARTNVEALSGLLGPPLAVLPWMGTIACNENDRRRLASTIEAVADLDRLFESD